MPKGTMLDRLAGAMKTLGKREGKSLTPRQRVAAAQRWNSLADIGDGVGGFRADNPFLSDNIDKYAEQSDFIDWCRYNGLEPNGRNLKTFRWETYKGMSIPQREKIYRNYDPRFLPEEKMWRSRSDMPDYLPVGWNEVGEF